MAFFGHKKMPKHPEETLQRTMQNMRDKNWIKFLGKGEYELTDEGYKLLLFLKPKIQYFNQEYKGKTYEDFLNELK